MLALPVIVKYLPPVWSCTWAVAFIVLVAGSIKGAKCDSID